jgi:hypothetical protein
MHNFEKDGWVKVVKDPKYVHRPHDRKLEIGGIYKIRDTYGRLVLVSGIKNCYFDPGLFVPWNNPKKSTKALHFVSRLGTID